jgi:hypothetical protein
LTYLPVQVRAAGVSDDSLRPLVGRYGWSFERALEVKASSRRGLLEVTDYFQTPVYPVSSTEFVTDIPGIRLRIVKQERGAATEIVHETRGYQKVLRRLPAGARTPLELLRAGPFDEAVEAYRNYRGQHPDEDAVSEGRLNRLGYQCLSSSRVEEALAWFRLNTQLYPNSSNAFDSLAEAFEAVGDAPSAVDHYQRAVQLDPGNTHARKRLAKLPARR